MIDQEEDEIINMMQQISFKQSDRMFDQSYQFIANRKQKNIDLDTKQPIHRYIYLKTNQLQKNDGQGSRKRKNKLAYQNQILSKYFMLIIGQQCSFSLVQSLPHTTNLKSNVKFEAGEHILSIPFNLMIGEKQFMHAKINKYIQNIYSFVQSRQNIFTLSFYKQGGFHLKMIEADLLTIIQLKSVLYLFQAYFVRQITNQLPSFQQDSQWLYFQLLPNDFSYLPIHYWKQIKDYHPAISAYLENKEYSITKAFNDIEFYISGGYLKQQYSFLTFLTSQLGQENGKQWYQKFINVFTLKNYVFALQCQRTRIYNNEDSQQPMLLPKRFLSNHKQKVMKQSVFISILDLIHHSYMNANLKWIFNVLKNTIDIVAIKQISSGDQLYICYNNMPIQNQMVEYGFVDRQSECYLGISLGVNQNLMIQIIENMLNTHLDVHIHEWIRTFIGSNFRNITLGLTSNKMKLFQNTDNLLQVLIQFIWNELVLFANNVISLLYKSSPNQSKNNISINQKYQYSTFRKHLQLSLIQAININIQEKQNYIQNLKYNIHILNYKLDNNFNLNYTMRCLFTVLMSQFEWLSLIKSKFNII